MPMRARLRSTCLLLAVLAACTSASGPPGEPATAPPQPPAIPEAQPPLAPPVADAEPEPSEPVAARARVARDIVRGSIMRLELGVPVDDLEVGASDRLGGHRIRKRTLRELDAEALTMLAALLNDPDGYDDQTMRRCAVDRQVGIRLVRAPTPDRDQLVDLVLDFPCQRLWVLEAGGTGFTQVANVDPSRAGWFALLKHALPDDRELARLE